MRQQLEAVDNLLVHGVDIMLPPVRDHSLKLYRIRPVTHGWLTQVSGHDHAAHGQSSPSSSLPRPQKDRPANEAAQPGYRRQRSLRGPGEDSDDSETEQWSKRPRVSSGDDGDGDKWGLPCVHRVFDPTRFGRHKTEYRWPSKLL
jgi:hypothetical protein